MMHPYGQFLTEFADKHADSVHRNRPGNTRAAVIVETRALYFLPMVIRNVMFFLGPEWNLHLFCSADSRGFLLDSLPGWEPSVTQLPRRLRRLPPGEYNAILTSPAFWNRFSEDKLLIFQHDSLLCGRNIEEFTGYDYVGAPCGRFDERYTGNGGLSLRTRQVMLDCLARFPPEPGEPEDVFFTRAARRLGAAVPALATACRFSVESLYTGQPVGVHGTDKFFHGLDIAEKIIAATSY
jgi:hypothetical protein